LGWLEVVTDDVVTAASHFAGWGVVRRDEIEKLPEGFNGFWIANPAGIIHLVAAGRTSGAEPPGRRKRDAGA
jgi:hypothetical protein